jgi:predicted nucleic acid-binding protein
MAVGLDTSFLVAFEVAEHPLQSEAKALFRGWVEKKQAIALCPQVLAEFVHVITDARRFKNPVSMEMALDRTEQIWNGKEVRKVYASGEATALFLHWMRSHRLGRKRILDTQLAAIYYTNQIKEIATTDFRDFDVFEVFKIHRL